MAKQLVKRLLNGALLIVSVVACAFFINFGARAVFQSDGFQFSHQNGIRVVEYVLKQRPDIYGDDSSIIAHPYLLYTNRPGFSGQGFLQIDANGYRIVPQPQRAASERPKKVLVLGGSTTFSYPYVADPANAWPAQLQKMLGP